MKILDLPSDFQSQRDAWGGEGENLDAVVLHTTEGTDSRTWLTQTGNVSANALIRNEGGEPVIYRLVPREFAAWHAGRIVGTPTTPLYGAHGGANPNLWTYGIEIEGFAAGPLDPVLLPAILSEVRYGLDGNDGPRIARRELAGRDDDQVVECGSEVGIGWMTDALTGKFTPPPEPVVARPVVP